VGVGLLGDGGEEVAVPLASLDFVSLVDMVAVQRTAVLTLR
jgi:hypothetical protein